MRPCRVEALHQQQGQQEQQQQQQHLDGAAGALAAAVGERHGLHRTSKLADVVGEGVVPAAAQLHDTTLNPVEKVAL